MIIKVSYKKETHVMVLDHVDFEGLLAKVRESFTKLPTSICLSYVDSEGDRISVTDTNDLNVIFEIPKQKSIRLEIEDLEGTNQESTCEIKESERFEDIENISEIEKPLVEEKEIEIPKTNSLVYKFDPE